MVGVVTTKKRGRRLAGRRQAGGGAVPWRRHGQAAQALKSDIYGDGM